MRAAVSGDRGSPEAVATLVEQAWPEVYALARRLGVRGPDAEDLTQAYFTRFLEKRYLNRLERWDGCIRPFLRTSLRHFLSNARDHARALKRGGRVRTVSLDQPAAGDRLRIEFVDRSTPESLLEAAEQQRAMRRAIAAVRGELRRSGQRQRLETLLHDLGDGGASHEIASRWGVSAVAVRVAVHRLRRRLARALDAETGAEPAEGHAVRPSISGR